MGHSNCFTQPDLDGTCLQAKQESSPTENVLQKRKGEKNLKMCKLKVFTLLNGPVSVINFNNVLPCK